MSNPGIPGLLFASHWIGSATLITLLCVSVCMCAKVREGEGNCVFESKGDMVN